MRLRAKPILQNTGWLLRMPRHVFEGDVITVSDQRKDYGEPRFATLGVLHGRVVFVAHTVRTGKVRIISMRKANEREQKFYQERLAAHRLDER